MRTVQLSNAVPITLLTVACYNFSLLLLLLFSGSFSFRLSTRCALPYVRAAYSDSHTESVFGSRIHILRCLRYMYSTGSYRECSSVRLLRTVMIFVRLFVVYSLCYAQPLTLCRAKKSLSFSLSCSHSYRTQCIGLRCSRFDVCCSLLSCDWIVTFFSCWLCALL